MALVLLATATAAADPSLRLKHAPAPRHLHMRSAQVNAPPPPAARPPLPVATAPQAAASAPKPLPDQDELAGLRDLRDSRVSITINLGYQVEAAPPSGLASLGGRAPQAEVDYSRIRSYGFAELFASERGVGLDNVSGYLSLRAEAAQQLTANGQVIAPPIANWFHSSGEELRTAWIEAKNFLPERWGLDALRLRAGTQYVYGAWPMHIDTPVMLAWDGPIFSATGFAGTRHPDFTRDLPKQDLPNQPFVAGATARFDLRGLHAPLPITVAAEVLHVGETTDHAAAVLDAPTNNVIGVASDHFQAEADWRPSRDLALIAQARWQDRRLANEHLTLRARYKQVTNFVAELTVRQNTDWQWDPAIVLPEADPMTPRRYLDLGPVLPQVIASVRAGTLIAENIDLYARGALAADLTKTHEPTTGINASYAELGGAVEVRVRRTMSITASASTRQNHLAAGPKIVDDHATAKDLPDPSLIGERGFFELGTGVRLSLGARRFSALAEVYGRRTRYAELYTDAFAKLPTSDVRGGGRFTVDAWIGKRVRLYASYDLSSAFTLTPEITGYKSLRLAISGVY